MQQLTYWVFFVIPLILSLLIHGSNSEMHHIVNSSYVQVKNTDYKKSYPDVI